MQSNTKDIPEHNDDKNNGEDLSNDDEMMMRE